MHQKAHIQKPLLYNWRIGWDEEPRQVASCVFVFKRMLSWSGLLHKIYIKLKRYSTDYMGFYTLIIFFMWGVILLIPFYSSRHISSFIEVRVEGPVESTEVAAYWLALFHTQLTFLHNTSSWMLLLTVQSALQHQPLIKIRLLCCHHMPMPEGYSLAQPWSWLFQIGTLLTFLLVTQLTYWYLVTMFFQCFVKVIRTQRDFQRHCKIIKRWGWKHGSAV